MKRLFKEYPVRSSILALILFYGFLLAIIELFTSKDHFKHYISDISGPVFFFAINTTLTASLLLGAALLFAVNYSYHLKFTKSRRGRIFSLWQFSMFFFLGLDERFLFHEKLTLIFGGHFNTEILLYPILLIMQLTLLFTCATHLLAKKSVVLNLALAGIAFFIMFLLDAYASETLPMRLAIEDTAKAISCLFLFLYSWDVLQTTLDSQSNPSA